ncbi:ELWxxDGT repeat protein [Psychroserpens sp. MEBiC05023]
MKKVSISIFLILLSILSSQAQEQLTTFADLTADKDADPTDFFEFNNQLFFLAENDIYGEEIWVTNGEIGSATLLKDINPGSKNGTSYPFVANSQSRKFQTQTAILNNELYFIATDGNSDGELWKTDGTTDGTVRITDFLNHDVEQLTLVNGELFFFIRRSGQTKELWKSDGTSSGTILVKGDLEFSNLPHHYSKINNTFIFATFGVESLRIWRSDGTNEGTYQIISFLNSAFSINLNDNSLFFKFNNELYFTVHSNSIDFGDPQKNVGIMKTDGTIPNTVPVVGLFDISIYYGSDFSRIIELNNKIYISFARFSPNKLHIYEVDLITQSAQTIYDEERNDIFHTSDLITNGNSLFFCGPNSLNNTALLSVNLNDYSVNEIKELTADSYADYGTLKTVNSNTYYISIPTNNNENEAWFSNLTEASTNRVSELDNLEIISSYNDDLFFSYPTVDQGNELWKYDTTSNTSIQIDNINPYHEGFREYNGNFTGLRKNDIAVINDKIVFGAKDDTNGDEPRVYNNTDNTVTLLQDINSGNNGSFSGGLISGYFEYDNDIYFSAYNPTYGEELWRTDGTINGTVINQDVFNGSSSSDPRYLLESQGLLYFLAGNSPSLWSTDGTNRTLIKSFGSTFAVDMIEKNGLIYISLIDTNNLDSLLWVSDGDIEGTTNLATHKSINDITVTDNYTFFSTQEVLNGEIELWKTDGSIAGTQLVKDIGIGYSSIPHGLIAFGDSVIFSAFTNENGRELWISDGTESGTTLLKDIFAGVNSGLDFNSEFFTTDEFVYFSANDGSTGTELWRTDGTEAGTVLIKDINAGISGSNATEFVKINNTIYFQAFEASQGSELWKTDGTEAGTLNVTDDISPGVSGSVPRDIISSEGDLFFTAVTETHGRQLWKIAGETLSNESIEVTTEVSIFPNPSKNTIHFNTTQSVTNASIFNINGQLINIFDRINNNTIDISKLTAGLYIIEFELNGKSYNSKILKQ